jgi:hypothetical protein
MLAAVVSHTNVVYISPGVDSLRSLLDAICGRRVLVMAEVNGTTITFNASTIRRGKKKLCYLYPLGPAQRLLRELHSKYRGETKRRPLPIVIRQIAL